MNREGWNRALVRGNRVASISLRFLFIASWFVLSSLGAEAQTQTTYISVHDVTTKTELGASKVSGTSWTHTVSVQPGEETTVLVVTVALSDNVDTISVTYDGAPMDEIKIAGGEGAGKAALYGLRGPASGKLIEVAFSGSTINTAYVVASSMTLVNVRPLRPAPDYACYAADNETVIDCTPWEGVKSSSGLTNNVNGPNKGNATDSVAASGWTNTLWVGTATVITNAGSLDHLNPVDPAAPAEDAYLNHGAAAKLGEFAAGASKKPYVGAVSGSVSFTWKAVNSSDVGLGLLKDSIAMAEFVGIQGLTAIRMDGLEALTTREGNKVRWRTGWEVANLGYSVWREVDGTRIRVTPSVIAGSALVVGPRAQMTGGRTYEWIDRKSADPAASYWVEEIALDGRRKWHGPIAVVGGDVSTGRIGTTALGPDRPKLLTELASCPAPSASEPGFPAFPRDEAAREPELQNVVSAEEGPAEIQKKLAAGEAVKALVSRQGWHRVTREALVAAGMDSSVNAQSLRLFTGGVEEPLLVTEVGPVAKGKGASFYVEFYGRPQDTPWTGTRTYWFTRTVGQGKRISTSMARAGGRTTEVSFPFTVERRDRSVYYVNLTNNGDEASFFGAAVLGTEPTDQEMIVTNLGAAGASTYQLAISLQGVTDVAHSVRVLFNGNYAGTVGFEKFERGSTVLEIPANWLAQGSNIVTLRGESGDMDISLVDWIRLTYPHAYVAENGALLATATRGSTVTISGFPSRSVRLFDVTDVLNVTQIPATVIDAPGGASIIATVPESSGRTATILAVDDSRVLSPGSVVTNVPSRWNENRLNTNYWIIGHSSLLPSVSPLAALRASQGLRVQTVDVEDLYDEFSFGEKSPYAIRDFLQSRRGSVGAKYLLLVGGASFDPRDFLGMGQRDLLPTKLEPEGSMKSAYDGWFVDFANEGLPYMSVGRLPVRTAAELSALLGKTLRWETAVQAAEPWTRSVLGVADENDPPAESPFEFEAAVDMLGGIVNPPFAVTTLKLGQVSGAKELLRSALNGGPGFVSFVGHGSPDSWSKHRVFSRTDAFALTNATQPSVFLAFNCLNGFIIDVYQDSMAEGFLKNPAGGAVAILASSSLTEPEGQSLMAKAVFRSAFAGGGLRLGDAIAAGRAGTPSGDVRRSFNLFGDPALKLRQ